MDLKKISKQIIGVLLLIAHFNLSGQVMSYCADPAFEEKVANSIEFSVPVISVEELQTSLSDDIILLDIREKEEYEISHIPGAQYFGFDNPIFDSIEEVEKDQKIIVYCSIGYRSEKIGEQLQDLGYSNVYNLYGSIFEWANKGCPLENSADEKTTQVHTYNKRWSKWVNNAEIEKIW